MGREGKIEKELKFSIFPLDYNDLKEVVEIESVSFPEPWSLAMFYHELILPFSHFYVMREDSQEKKKSRMIAYGGFWMVKYEAHITNLAVHPDYRSRGFGNEFLRFLLEKANNLGAKVATLEVRTSNRVGLKLYEKWGFQKTKTKKGYYAYTGEDAIVMEKRNL
ncbi:ribosomal protein S18-alanine N-acetyltransferase [bacterium]|nr:ribosomal protein S18-alanine N-acetyltransferase [bacterium]